jgi:histidyl-tRNA synthetase
MQELIENAPKLMHFLGDASRAHLQGVLEILQANKVPYRINPRLVRGMDYYNLTVFEFVTTRLGSQGTICAGGRYDYLMQQIGGKPAPAVGWAIGFERVLELLKEGGIDLGVVPLHAYAVVQDESAYVKVLPFLQELRLHGVSVQMHARGTDGVGSLKSQFKRADASSASFALVFGQDEVSKGQVTVKALRNADMAQLQWPMSDGAALAQHLQS